MCWHTPQFTQEGHLFLNSSAWVNFVGNIFWHVQWDKKYFQVLFVGCSSISQVWIFCEPILKGSTIDQHGYDRPSYGLNGHNFGHTFYQASGHTTHGLLGQGSWQGYNSSYSYEPTYDCNGQNSCYQWPRTWAIMVTNSPILHVVIMSNLAMIPTHGFEGHYNSEEVNYHDSKRVKANILQRANQPVHGLNMIQWSIPTTKL